MKTDQFVKRWKLKIDLIKLTKSAVRWVRQPGDVEKGVMMGKPLSKERHHGKWDGRTVVQEFLVTSDLPLSEVPYSISP